METRSDTQLSHKVPDGARHAATEPGVLRGVVSGMFSAVLVGLLLLVLAVTVIPKVLGGAGLAVLSGSMEPTYSPGDMVISVPQEDYAIGDVVTFQPVSGDPTLVTHRIVGHRGGDHGVSYVTRGDANANEDDPIVHAQIMGKVIYHVPYVGYVTQAFGEHRSLLIGIAATGLFGYAAYAISFGLIQDRRRKRSEQP
ncbi:MAG TPA: signal peptidase I [Enteractinococcus sp.]